MTEARAREYYESQIVSATPACHLILQSFPAQSPTSAEDGHVDPVW
jgi:hypothetical protein